ncbi:hypothetical protein AL542_17840 [Grimontia hollisae]|uniref:Uncharacterized protein n=2 Tax=Grimontia hollisae TaxID=673 RepID=D0IAZ9_GRIHO|nr:NirD/YgiW/YdeI family stress tolerance protein [Grimontia hollisae]AMG32016.1 hypothetical protein AL542_17840 [Grimontia hollisae]EEY71067.1 hypothetical protein VHA_002926 [Grimontia hollisae CIP 101886]STO44139.1 Uncharacterized conserved protein [Grimontia hollisae]STO57249.1 Uncharacterized conserved protein [Grimontia hollisae]
MKKYIALSVLMVLSSSAFAAFQGPSVNSINTVKAALEAKDESAVVLKGHIVQELGSELYLFRDSTGEIQVEIDNEDWLGQNVTPNDNVTIRGEVDTEWRSVKIDVDTITKN